MFSTQILSLCSMIRNDCVLFEVNQVGKYSYGVLNHAEKLPTCFDVNNKMSF